MLIVCALIVVSVIGLPWLTTRLTQPAWAVVKAVIEFLLIAFILGLFLPYVNIPAAFAIAFIRYKSRVARYEQLTATNAGETSAGPAEETPPRQD